MSSLSFADHFSSGATDYARFRPDYPAALFEWLAGTVRQHQVGWDCATGNGQAAVALGSHFGSVVATDGSAAQVAAAARAPRVRYACAIAERVPLRDDSIDLVTVAQALHWLDLDAFYGEVNRVVRGGGVIAVWSYGQTSVAPEIDEVVAAFYHDTVGAYWPPGRCHVENGYRDLAFPFVPIGTPRLDMVRHWTADELLGYIGTWSAVHRYRTANGDAAVEAFAARLRERWGDSRRRRDVRWPLTMRVGRVAER